MQSTTTVEEERVDKPETDQYNQDGETDCRNIDFLHVVV